MLTHWPKIASIHLNVSKSIPWNPSKIWFIIEKQELEIKIIPPLQNDFSICYGVELVTSLPSLHVVKGFLTDILTILCVLYFQEMSHFVKQIIQKTVFLWLFSSMIPSSINGTVDLFCCRYCLIVIYSQVRVAVLWSDCLSSSCKCYSSKRKGIPAVEGQGIS